MAIQLENNIPAPEGEKETGRLEAFSDGVFAIAITLLVLDIKVPSVEALPKDKGLAEVLLEQWPIYLAFFTSFITILIMWVNHHNIFKNVRRVDHYFLIINGLLLLFVTVTPFSTSLLAEYLQYPGQNTAAVVYSGAFLLVAVTFNILWRYATYKGRLLSANADMGLIRGIDRAYTVGPFLYVICFVLAFFSGLASFILTLVLAIYFALPFGVNSAPLNE